MHIIACDDPAILSMFHAIFRSFYHLEILIKLNLNVNLVPIRQWKISQQYFDNLAYN